MTELVFKQFELARGWCIEVAESVPEEIVHVQPAGFNNTIQWHIGHILTVTEYFMLDISKKMSYLPANYSELFVPGTKPAEWKGDVPTANELITQLKDQLVRLQQIPAGHLNELLEKPLFGFETYGECAGFALLHEALHIGKMKEMKRVIEYKLPSSGK
ncbi:DinB family protein [Bacillus sp. CECT 9360]|uniref:DinB family protein n=1 Tax=Bacillus sp. CECT 9360 TaxID=2845821 RepID=UPI001E4425E2|nr:DinB family protein [Bacillus sp. CECT 9360]CAH0346632.1 hypothetical protein BCI9360_02975 [Bacillus sp. CECT 9360]